MSSDIDVVVVTYESTAALAPTLSLLAPELADDVNLWLVDNGSSDLAALAALAGDHGASLHEIGWNSGFAHAVNRGAALGDAPYLLLLNPDCAIDAHGVRTLRDLAGARRAVVGPVARGDEGQRSIPAGFWPSARAMLMQFSGLAALAGHRHPWLRGFTTHGSWTSRTRPWPVDWVSGGCLMIPRPLWDQVGPLSERWFMYGEDVDLCVRAKAAGFEVLVEPEVEVVHVQGTGSVVERTEEQVDWLRNLRDLHHGRSGPGERMLFDGVLLLAGAGHSLLRSVEGRPRRGRPGLAQMLQLMRSAPR